MGLLESIDNALVICINEQQKEGSYEYLPGIIRSLEKIRDIIYYRQKYEKEQRKKTAAALGRLIMESYSFSESELGTMLLKIADEFAKSSNR